MILKILICLFALFCGGRAILWAFMEGPEAVREFREFKEEMQEKVEEWRELFHEEEPSE